MTDSLATVERALTALLEAHTARVVFYFRQRFIDYLQERASSIGDRIEIALLRAAGRIGAYAVRKAGGTPRVVRADGYVDLDRWFCFLDYVGGRRFITDGEREWHDMKQPVRKTEVRPQSTIQPLWLLDMLRGAIAATEDPSVSYITDHTRKLSVDIDVQLAMERAPVSLLPPPPMEGGSPRSRITLLVEISEDSMLAAVEYPAGLVSWRIEVSDYGVVIPPVWSYPKTA